jgi:hypothetical protein
VEPLTCTSSHPAWQRSPLLQCAGAAASSPVVACSMCSCGGGLPHTAVCSMSSSNTRPTWSAAASSRGCGLNRWCVLVSLWPPPLVPSCTVATSTTGACSRSGGLTCSDRWRSRPHFHLRRSAFFGGSFRERGGLCGHGGKDKMKRLRVGLCDVLNRDAMTFHES